MPDLINVDIIENNKGGHEDLLFSIPNLIEDQIFDTYYFYLAVEPAETIDHIKYAVSNLIQFWRNKISGIKKDETIFLPIDFSDQYTGCLNVRKQDEKLVLIYGYSNREGYAVDPLNPENYYKEITDFEADSENIIIVEQSVFILALEKQINKLRSGRHEN